jgi:hypothetical protein
MPEAKVLRCYFRSVGQNLTADALCVDFEVDGEAYTHQIANDGWSYQTPALQFFGLMGIRPSQFEDGEYSFGNETVDAVWIEQQQKYLIDVQEFFKGAEKLSETDWFNPEGEVWNGSGNQVGQSVAPDPGTGNRAGVPVDGEK